MNQPLHPSHWAEVRKRGCENYAFTFRAVLSLLAGASTAALVLWMIVNDKLSSAGGSPQRTTTIASQNQDIARIYAPIASTPTGKALPVVIPEQKIQARGSAPESLPVKTTWESSMARAKREFPGMANKNSILCKTADKLCRDARNNPAHPYHDTIVNNPDAPWVLANAASKMVEEMIPFLERDSYGRLIPKPGYLWRNSDDPDDLRVVAAPKPSPVSMPSPEPDEVPFMRRRYSDHEVEAIARQADRLLSSGAVDREGRDAWFEQQVKRDQQLTRIEDAQNQILSQQEELYWQAQRQCQPEPTLEIVPVLLRTGKRLDR